MKLRLKISAKVTVSVKERVKVSKDSDELRMRA